MPENPEEIRPGGPRRQNPIRTVPDEPQKRTRRLLSSVVSTRRCCRRGGAQGQGARIPTRQPFDLENRSPRGPAASFGCKANARRQIPEDQKNGVGRLPTGREISRSLATDPQSRIVRRL